MNGIPKTLIPDWWGVNIYPPPFWKIKTPSFDYYVKCFHVRNNLPINNFKAILVAGSFRLNI